MRRRSREKRGPAAGRPRTSAAAGTLLILGSLLFSAAAFEGIVRLAAPELGVPRAAGHFRFDQTFEFELPHHRRDAVLGWRLQPGVYGQMRVNAAGFRGPDWATAPPGHRKIALLGDSSTMGFTIAADAEVYGAMLPAMLQPHGVPLAARNFGVDGYSSHQGKLLLPQVLSEFAPHYVTLYFGYNDHHYANASDAKTRYRTPWLVAALEHSHAFRFMRRHLLRLLHREARLVEPVRRVDLDAFEANLRRMVADAGAAGAVPILMTTPLRPGRPLTENEMRLEDGGRSTWMTQDAWLARELEARGTSLERSEQAGSLLAFVDTALQQHPDWAYLHFLRARELERRGDSQGARSALGQAALHDRERAVMEQYNERVRLVARSLDAELLDLARSFEARRAPHLFNDVVHPSKVGHELIAEALSQTLLRLEGRTQPEHVPAEGG
jgi:lysophospholipase L1-like esterase